MSSVTSYRPPSDSVNNPNLSTNSTNQNNKLQVVNIVDYQSAKKTFGKSFTDFHKQSTTIFTVIK